MTVEYINKGAEISKDGIYRYRLWREWRGTHDPENWRWFGAKDGAGEELGEPKACVFIMLNPSTADGETDDPTIRKCVSFCRLWRYELLIVVNLFAFRATKPKELFKVGEPVGWENQSYVERSIHRAGLIVCAWGSIGGYLGQDQTMLGWIDKANIKDARVVALGLTTSNGQPRHPLYIPYAVSFSDYDPL